MRRKICTLHDELLMRTALRLLLFSFSLTYQFTDLTFPQQNSSTIFVSFAGLQVLGKVHYYYNSSSLSCDGLQASGKVHYYYYSSSLSFEGFPVLEKVHCVSGYGETYIFLYVGRCLLS